MEFSIVPCPPLLGLARCERRVVLQAVHDMASSDPSSEHSEREPR